MKFDKDEEIENALSALRQRTLGDDHRSPSLGLLSPVIGPGGMKRSPALGVLSHSNGEGWILTDTVQPQSKADVTRGWSFETRPRANTEPKRPEPVVLVEETKRTRDDSVSVVRGVLRMSPTPGPTPSPPSPTVEQIRVDTYAEPPPKMGTLRRGSSPFRKPKGASIKEEFLQTTTMNTFFSPAPSPIVP